MDFRSKLEAGSGELLGTRAAVGGLLTALVAWLWPVGFGGRMLVGGDVTRFFMGLMAVLGESLRALRLPIWNDLWGFGFPGLAESQMGVYYPPHLFLYGLFRVETAYVVSLVLHTLWGGLGAFWASRKFGISNAGSALASFAWAASGFFIIHMSHPWGYTSGSWMPWAWGLTWTILSGRASRLRLAVFLLSLVVCLQILPGHFQIAFMTEVGMALMLAWSLWNGMRTRGKAAPGSESPEVWSRRPFLAFGMVVLGIAVAFPLAGMQLVPTARLARLANQQRDLEYLAGFAATPFHLVSYVAPGLFHYAPSWRPLVWDPFITSPEEHLAYVGLVPLLLALTAMFRERRRDAGLRMLTFLTVVLLYLSLGPNVPGFRQLIEIPGFSFFRAPARWALPISMSLALLAGKGFDRLRDRTRPGRSIAAFVVFAMLWVGGIVGAIELSMNTNGRSDTAALLRRGFALVSWQGPQGWDRVVSTAHQPNSDPNIPEALARLNIPGVSRGTPSFASRRYSIYADELGQTGIVLALLSVVGILQFSSRGREALPILLLSLTFVDLMLLARHRMSDLETAPWRPLVEQSPVLAELAKMQRGTRSVDALRNFPMIAGLAPVSAYRTMDLPVALELTQYTHLSLDLTRNTPRAIEAMNAVGAGVRSFDPVENLVSSHADKIQGAPAAAEGSGSPAWKRGSSIEDPALANWQYGSSWVDRQGSWARTYRLGTPPEPPARAWFVDLGGMAGDLPGPLKSADAATMLGVFAKARPVATESSRPGLRTVELDHPTPGAWVIVTELSDPQWTARWVGREGQEEQPAEVVPIFGGQNGWGWQGVKSPGPGRWTLILEYDARDVRLGLLVSAVAWVLWIAALAATRNFAVWRSFDRVGS